MWRRGLLLPGLGGSLERENLEFHFELPGGSVIDELTISSSQFLPGHDKVVVAEYRQEAAAYDARLDRGLISCRLADLHETAVRAERVHCRGTRNAPDWIEHDIELSAARVADALGQPLGLLEVDRRVRSDVLR